MLGGVEIPYKMGLDGHSDADVLIHAIIDAIVSPTLATDVGRLFPDTDERYKNIDSSKLLARACALIYGDGWQISNIDTVVIAEAPKIAPYINGMRTRLADIMQIDLADITIKGKTAEGLGAIGRGEGIAATAVSLLIKNNFK